MTVRLNEADRERLYAARRVLSQGLEEKLGLQVPFLVYFQDPLVAEKNPELGLHERKIPWEPGLADGPTSARFAVVDYNADTETLAKPARWDAKRLCYCRGKTRLGPAQKDLLQFHQVNLWATLQWALQFFEQAQGLGRPLPWGFEGNRLIVVPHAGYGKNAYYDRQSKSLQFYYFDRDGERIYTCLSADIIHHELAHAILDGIRPLLIESTSIETAAFHEAIGDITAILIALRNNEFRRQLVEDTGGDLASAEALAHVAEQFGHAAKDRPYLRSAVNTQTLKSTAASNSPHAVSEVLRGAIFDILIDLSKDYAQRGHSPARAFNYTIQRLQGLALQPLDLLPPIDVTFRDYALAVLRNDELAHPHDPRNHRERIARIFYRRGILTRADLQRLRQRTNLRRRHRLGVYHPVDRLRSSRAAAYRFLDDNREELFLPKDRDILVSDLYTARKEDRQRQRLGPQTILEYTWREEVPLEGSGFGEYQGSRTSLLCGGTLVFDDEGAVISWARKPGSQADPGTTSEAGLQEQGEGLARRAAFLGSLEQRLTRGQVATPQSCERGLLGSHMPPFTVHQDGGELRFELTPHMNLSDDHSADDPGERRWQISS